MRPREILIAAFVLIVLGGTIWAVMLKQQGDALKIASARNLQQWGIALNLYLMDNQNQMPSIGKDSIHAEQKNAWYNALPPYISQKPLAELPPGQRPRPGVPSLWMDPSTKPVRVWDPEVFYFNYGMNRALQPLDDVRSFRIYEINHPQNVLFMTETAGYSPWVTPESVAFRHGGVTSLSSQAKAHVLYCDGRVALLTRSELVNDPETLKAAAAEKQTSWYQK